MTEPAGRVHRLVGVYDAEGTVAGELRYWIGARLGRAHCALCDLTHGLVRERADWRECRADLGVEFDTYHRDDQPDAVRDAAAGVVPVVLAETAVGFVVVLGPAELDSCHGSLTAFSELLEQRLAARGLTLG